MGQPLRTCPDDRVAAVPGVPAALAPPAEVDAYVDQFAGERDGAATGWWSRNGYHEAREALTSAGAVEVTAPRVNNKRVDPDTGERKRFSSAILPPWARNERSPKYLHRLSSGDFIPALGQFLGAFCERDLSTVDFVYLRADGLVRREALGIEGGVRPPRWAVAAVRWELSAPLSR
jgi:hypothetical protein